MKRLLLVLLALFLSPSLASADVTTFDLDIESFGADDSDNNGASEQLVASVDFVLPAIDSLDAVLGSFTHDYGSEIAIQLIAPNANSYWIVAGSGPNGGSGFDAGFDSTQLGITEDSFLLDDLAEYVIVEDGTATEIWLNSPDLQLAAGTYAQRATAASENWASGSFAAGTWTLNLYDAWDDANEGSVGYVGLAFTPAAVPEPSSALVCGLAVAGMALVRRRRC